MLVYGYVPIFKPNYSSFLLNLSSKERISLLETVNMNSFSYSLTQFERMDKYSHSSTHLIINIIQTVVFTHILSVETF